MKNSEIIDNPNYYRLPCGKYLEDFIWNRGLSFALGSALKYRWRAGHKDGESKEKDMNKCMHYVRSMSKHYCKLFCKEYDEKFMKRVVEYLYNKAIKWDGNDLHR